MREMKDSGIEWIGEIPENWKVVPIKIAFSEVKTKNTDGAVTNALKFKFGEIVPKTNFDSETDDYVADTILNYTIVEPRTIMINGLNLNYDFKTLRTGLVKEKGIITSAYLALKPDENIIWAEYATYLFKGYETKMAFHNMGSGIRLTLGFKEFKNQPLMLPALPEQKAIAGFLDKQCAEIDAVIEQTKVTIEEYKKLKQSVITEAVTKGIRGDRPMKDSGIEWIGEIPSHWGIIKFKYLHNGLNTGEAIDKNFWSSQSTDRLFYTAGLEPIRTTFEGFPNWKYTSDNDLLLARNGTPYVYLPSANACYTDHIIRASMKTSSNRRFVRYSLQQSISSVVVETVSIPTWSASLWNEQSIPHPSLEEQEEIVSYLDQKCAEIDTLISKKTALLEEMETYKKSVIYEYVTGKKEVV